MTKYKLFFLLIGLVCILLLLKDDLFSLLLNVQRGPLGIYSLRFNNNDDDLKNLINIGFSAFEYQQAKLQELEVHSEYDLTAVLLHWKRFEGLHKTFQYLLHTHLFKEIIIWNNNPQINLTLHQFTKNNHSNKLIRIINSPENLHDEAKYRACAEARTRACFYVDDDWNVAHYLKSLIASFRSDPNLLHAVTDAYTFYTNLVWTYFDSKIDLHSGFSWIGCGSVFLRQHAQHHLQLMHNFLRNHSDLIRLSDVFFSVWLNDIPVQFNTDIRYQHSPSSKHSPSSNYTVSFSSTSNFSDHQYTSSVLAIRILEQSLRFDRFKKEKSTFPRQQNRHFPSYVKSPSINDDFIFYTNLLPFHFENISFNISHDFQRGTRKNLPQHPSVKYFQHHTTWKAVDGDLSTCWHAHREIQPNDFYAIDFLSIQTSVMFMVAVAHNPALQTKLDVSISFDGLYWSSYRSLNGIYRKHNRAWEEHLYTYLFDSSKFNVGFRSFRYISFKAMEDSQHRFQVCEIQIPFKEKFTTIMLDFDQLKI